MNAPRPRPHVPNHCPDCGQPINWWRIAGSDEEKWCAVDPSSDPDKGRVRRVSTNIGDRIVNTARFLPRAQVIEAMANGELLFTAHRDTCSARRQRNPRPAHVRVNFPRGDRRRTRR